MYTISERDVWYIYGSGTACYPLEVTVIWRQQEQRRDSVDAMEN